MRRVLAFLSLAALVAAVPASAQDKPWNLNLGGGFTTALSEVKNHLGNGYNFNLGVTFDLTPTVGIQAEYSFNGLGKKQISLPVSATPVASTATQPFYGDMNMQYGDLNLIFKPETQGKARPYVVAGMGIYHRPVKVTTPAVGYVPGYCDPFWFYCSPGGYVPVDAIVGSRSSTDFGMDFGAGVNVRVANAAAFYVEIRYHYIWGPQYTNPSTNAKQKGNGQFMPLTFGLRF